MRRPPGRGEPELVRLRVFVGIVGAAVLAAAVSVRGHHAFSAEFDVNKPIRLKGTVTKLEWVNPHAWIYIDVKDEKGKVTNWAIETGAPNALARRGWRRDSLPPGTVIIVDGYRAKSGEPMANGRDVTFSDGKRLFVGSSGTGAPDDKNRPK